ncbi:MAG: AGE family epimerase/isomerase [Pseudomonadota bacterium]
MSEVQNSLLRFRRWFFNDALPFWVDRGYDFARGGFHEAVDFEGTPLSDRPRRVRAQARQIHTFSQAGLRGWHDGAEALAAKGFDYYLATACPDDGARGCVHMISAEGSVIDDRRDLYDHAFHLLACASRWEAAKDDRALALADNAVAFLDRELASPNGGWLESDRKELPRRQNPHMHLFEAFLALQRVTDDKRYGDYAKQIHQLFCTAFFNEEEGVLREFFDNDWHPQSDNAQIEPGHMFEWVWLLHAYDKLNASDNSALAKRLFWQARDLGCDPDFFGFADNARSLSGQATRGAKRLWPQTEYLRASILLATDPSLSTSSRIVALVDALFETYFDTQTPGLWVDEFDAGGKPVAKDVPASVLYHVFEAVAEADAALTSGQRA